MKQKPNCLIIVAGVFVLSIILVLGFVIWKGLRPCGWLDIYVSHIKCVAELKHADKISFSPRGDILATALLDRNVHLWYITKGLFMQEMDNVTAPHGMAFAPNEDILATASWQTIQLWQISSGTQLQTLQIDKGTITGITFDPNGTTLAAMALDYSGSKPDDKVFLWQVSNAKLLQVLQGHISYVESIAYSPDGTMIASVDFGTVRLWRVDDGKLLQQLDLPLLNKFLSGNELRKVAFSPDGNILAIARGSTVQLWQVHEGVYLGALEGHTGLVLSLDFSPDGKVLASGAEDSTVRIWSIKDEKLLHILNHRGVLMGQGWILDVAFSPDGTLLATAQRRGPVRIFDVEQLY